MKELCLKSLKNIYLNAVKVPEGSQLGEVLTRISERIFQRIALGMLKTVPG